MRISFSGGGTDVAPYCDERGGCVLSSTIDMYAYATAQARPDGRVRIQSLDYDTVVKYDVWNDLALDGKLDLIKAVAQTINPAGGFDLFVHNDAPPGSGLGSSGCVAALITGLMARLVGRQLSPSEIAQTAIEVERNRLGIAGGRQDQFAAVYGGICYMEFSREKTSVHRLSLDPETTLELEYSLLLVYTRKTRFSDDLISHQVKLYERNDEAHIAALDEIKTITLEMKDLLVRGKVQQMGELLHEAWVNKKKMNAHVTTPYIDELYEEARKLGAQGGKILGAGGGGYLLLFCPFHRKHLIAQRAEQLGGQIVNFSLVPHGLQLWSAPAGGQRFIESMLPPPLTEEPDK